MPLISHGKAMCAEGMSLQGSWSDDGKTGRRVSTSTDYLHRQDTTGSTNSPEAPLTRQQHLWPETTPVHGPSAKPAAGTSLPVQQPRLALQVRSTLAYIRHGYNLQLYGNIICIGVGLLHDTALILQVTPEMLMPHGRRLRNPASVETNVSTQTIAPDTAEQRSVGRQVRRRHDAMTKAMVPLCDC